MANISPDFVKSVVEGCAVQVLGLENQLKRRYISADDLASRYCERSKAISELPKDRHRKLLEIIRLVVLNANGVGEDSNVKCINERAKEMSKDKDGDIQIRTYPVTARYQEWGFDKKPVPSLDDAFFCRPGHGYGSAAVGIHIARADTDFIALAYGYAMAPIIHGVTEAAEENFIDGKAPPRVLAATRLVLTVVDGLDPDASKVFWRELPAAVKALAEKASRGR